MKAKNKRLTHIRMFIAGDNISVCFSYATICTNNMGYRWFDLRSIAQAYKLAKRYTTLYGVSNEEFYTTNRDMIMITWSV